MAVIHFTEKSFTAALVTEKKPIVADFRATWCGPCRMLEPELKALAEERGDIVVGEIDVDESPALAAKYGIDSIPCVMLFQGGTEKKRVVGYRAKAELTKALGL